MKICSCLFALFVHDGLLDGFAEGIDEGSSLGIADGSSDGLLDSSAEEPDDGVLLGKTVVHVVIVIIMTSSLRTTWQFLYTMNESAIQYQCCGESNDLIYSDLKGFGCLLGQSTLKHLTSLR